MLKLSRAESLKSPALEKIDAHYARVISDEIGALGMVHMLKRMGALVNDDSDAIASRIVEQDSRLAEIERSRLAMKKRVRAATTVAEIHDVLSELE